MIPVLLHGDPGMEPVLTEPVFRAKVGKKHADAGTFLFISRSTTLTGKILLHQGTVAFVLPQPGKALPGVFYQTVVHQETVKEPVV